MSFYGDDALNPKQMARVGHIYSELGKIGAQRELQAEITKHISYLDVFTISLLMNNLYGTSKAFEDKKAGSPLFVLSETNKVLKSLTETLDGIEKDFKKKLYGTKEARALGVDPEPLYLAVHTLAKMLFFVNEAIFQLCGVLPHANMYNFWDILKLSLDKAYWENIFINSKPKKD